MGFILKHLDSFWGARENDKSFTGNYWLALGNPEHQNQSDARGCYMYLTNKRRDALVWTIEANEDQRIVKIKDYLRLIKRNRKALSKTMDI